MEVYRNARYETSNAKAWLLDKNKDSWFMVLWSSMIEHRIRDNQLPRRERNP